MTAAEHQFRRELKSHVSQPITTESEHRRALHITSGGVIGW